MGVLDPGKIEERINMVELASTAVEADMGGLQIDKVPQMLEMAKLMSLSGPAVPYVFRNNPGLCLAIWIKATRFGFDPFALANHAFVMVQSKKHPQTKQWEDVETLAYDSAVIRAIINTHAPIKDGIKYEFEGEGENVVCIAKCTTRSGVEIVHRSMTIAERKKSLRRNDDGKVKGSPLWDDKPLIQFAYDTGRDLCRVYFPEVLLGVSDRDDFEDVAAAARAATAKDVTPPKSKLAERLKGGAGKPGFSKDHVDRETGGSYTKSLTHDTSAVDMTPVGDDKPAAAAVAVEAQQQAEDQEAKTETAAETDKQVDQPQEQEAKTQTGAETEPEDLRPKAFDAGTEARDKNRPLHSTPDEFRGDEVLAEAYRDGWRQRDWELSAVKEPA